MKRILFVVFVILTTSSIAAAADKIDIKSPGGTVRALLFVDNGTLSYTLTHNNRPVLEASPFGIIIDGNDLGRNVRLGSTTRDSVRETYPTRGNHNTALNYYNQLDIKVLNIKTADLYTLQVRAYDDGLAYRYIIPAKNDRSRTINGETSSWRFPNDCTAWLQNYKVNYENTYRKQQLSSVPAGVEISPPVTVSLPGGAYALVTEANLVNYSGMSLETCGKNLMTANFKGDPDGWQQTGRIVTPWRVTVTANDLNALVNTDLLTNLCPPANELLKDADWIAPAVVAWQWWSSDAPKFEDQQWWIDKTAQLGLEYYLIDDGWRFWNSADKGPWQLLEEVVDYAQSKNVKILIWTHSRYLSEPISRWSFMSMAKDLDIKGFKIDYMDAEDRDMVNWYEATLRDAAKLGLMVNFHGAYKPTGRSRHWPNEMTREGIRGLEYNKWGKLQLDYYTALPFIRFVIGPGDFTPVTFDSEKTKGTTFAFQLATGYIYTSPQLHLADRLDRYLQSPALPLIRALKATWDETIVLPGSKIGEFAVFARRSGSDWFAAAINAGDQTQYPLDMSFLKPGSYQVLIAKDDLNNAPNLLVEEQQLDSSAEIKIEIPKGGGFIAWFKKNP